MVDKSIVMVRIEESCQEKSSFFFTYLIKPQHFSIW